MIVIVASYDPDYFKDNTFVLSDFETRDTPAVLTRQSGLVQTQWRNQQTSATTTVLREALPDQLWAGFTNRTFDSITLGAAEQGTNKLAGNYGPAMTGTVTYPAQDNPVVRVNVASFDLSDTNATNNSTTPVVG